MSRFDEKIEQYQGELNRLNLEFDIELLKIITKKLGPSIYKVDAEKVSGSDEREIETVKYNFLIKKLGLEDSPELDKAISTVIHLLGKSNRNKYRAIFYYLLVKELKQEAFYVS